MNYLYLLENSWEFKKIIETPIDDALAAGYECVGIDPDQCDLIELELTYLNFRHLLREMLIRYRVNGVAFILIGDMIDMNFIFPKPLERITKLTLLDIGAYGLGSLIIPVEHLVTLPITITYQIGTTFTGLGRLLYKDVMRAMGAREDLARIIKKNTYTIAYIRDQDLQNDNKQKNLQSTFEKLSNERIVGLDMDNCKLENFTQDIKNIMDYVTVTLKVLATASGFPYTKFLGESPHGLNHTADGDLENYYSVVRGVQKNVCDVVKILYRQIYLRTFLETAPVALDILPKSTWNLSEEEEQNIKEKKLQNIAVALKEGLITLEQAQKELDTSNVFTLAASA